MEPDLPPNPEPAPQQPTSEPVLPAPLSEALAPRLSEVRPAHHTFLDEWLSRNVAPLTVIFLSLLLMLAAEPLIPRTAPALEFEQQKAKTIQPEDVLKEDLKVDNPLSVVVMFAMLGGGIFIVACIVYWIVDPTARPAMLGFVRSHALRPLPALRVLDLIAIMVAMQAAATVAAAAILNANEALIRQPGVMRAAALVVNDFGFAGAVVAAIILARVRASGLHGSNGFWPFWRAAWDSTDHNLGRDVLLGLACYPIVLWIVIISKLASIAGLQALGVGVDQHPMIGAIAQERNPWIIATMFLTGTVGAAVLEEILFRGILYNVLRRYFGRMTGAVFAAAVFAVVHGLWSDWLGLFLLALVLTWLYDRTGRLVASITLHAANNFIALSIALTSG